MKREELLKEWLSIFADKKATVKAEPIVSKNTGVSDMGETNSKYIAGLMRRTIEATERPMEISPYNPAHTMYGDCCGIFNQINDDGILCCNECGTSINKLLDCVDERIRNEFAAQQPTAEGAEMAECEYYEEKGKCMPGCMTDSCNHHPNNR